MDWNGCGLVETVSSKVSGRPVVKGTRVLADAIIEDYDLGSPLEEIEENYPAVSVEDIKALISFARANQQQQA